MKKKSIYFLILLIILSCKTLEEKKEYEINFKVLENPTDYISIDSIQVKNEYIQITFTNNSNEIVKIIWPNTTLNESKVVTNEKDIELIDKMSIYKKQYTELFISPNASETLNIYPLNNAYKYKIVDKDNNQATYEYALTKLTFPVKFNFNIMNAKINTKNSLNILIYRTSKSK